MPFIRFVIAIIVQFPVFCSFAVGGFRIFWERAMKNSYQIGTRLELYRNIIGAAGTQQFLCLTNKNLKSRKILIFANDSLKFR